MLKKGKDFEEIAFRPRQRNFKSLFISKSLAKIVSKNAIALKKLIFLEKKDKMYDPISTLIPMVQTVFEIFMILS